MLITRHYLNIIALLVVLNASAIQAQENPLEISVAVSDEILSIYRSWISDKPCWEINDFKAKHSNRGAAELVMLCKAFHLSGIEFTFRFVPSKNYDKSLLLARHKQAHLSGESVWKSEADPELFYASPPIIRTGEFEKGIFTIKSHAMMLKVNEIKDLKSFRGVTMPSWKHDWRLLRKLTNRLVRANSPMTIHSMIANQQADFTLAEFNRDMRLDLNNVVLYPVPNVKIAIKQSRHFVVRKGMPNSQLVIDAITKGLTQMREQNMIKKIYIDAGFINQEVADWKTLNPSARYGL